MRTDSPGEQVRTAYQWRTSPALQHRSGAAFPDHLAQLLARLDAATEASHTVMQLPPHRLD